MTSNKVDIARLQEIINKTIDAINNSRNEILDIAENARRVCQMLQNELEILKSQVAQLIIDVDVLEEKLKRSQRRLMFVNKNFDSFTQQQYREAYEMADKIRLELAIKREQEQFYIKRRNDLEIRIRESQETVEKAEKLMENVGVALGYLTGDLKEVSLHLEDMQQRQLLGLRIIKAQEEERQRVARDIHDGPAQLMSNIVLKAELCERLIDIDLDKTKEELKKLKEIVRISLKDVRNIIYDLRPMSLDDLGLIPTIERCLSSFEEETGICIDFKTAGNGDNLSPAISLTVYRIVQEAISNVKKHAYADNIIIKLNILGDELKLEINDDGRGFNVQDLKKHKKDINSGFGIISMRERIELLNGTFNVSSRSGFGTKLFIKIPLITDEVSRNE